MRRRLRQRTEKISPTRTRVIPSTTNMITASIADGVEYEHAHEVAKTYNHVHDEAGAIKISDQAKGNIGLRMARVELSTFERMITMPGIVVERRDGR